MNILDAKKRVRDRIQPVREALAGQKELADMFEACFMDTLSTTFSTDPDGTAFVITGDIPAMWLRDSSLQVMHYLRFADDAVASQMLRALIERQMRCIRLDPYANAFNREANAASFSKDRPGQSPWVWERKYEIDSLRYPFYLAAAYKNKRPDADIFTTAFRDALKTTIELWEREQRHEESEYWFERDDCPPSDTLTNGGRGTPVAYTGMTWSGFRPSDDACALHYLIPSNLFAARVLADMAGFAGAMGDAALLKRALRLKDQIRDGINRYGMVDHMRYGRIYAYETDGLGHYTMMDDANMPSLLSLPYLGICEKDDPAYLRTRAFVLSGDNPFYYEGKYARGVGSPHTPKGYIWPIALCVQALTAQNDREIEDIVSMLLHTHAGTFRMHEGFDPNDPSKFTRSWFAWANSMFGELAFRLFEARKLDLILRAARRSE